METQIKVFDDYESDAIEKMNEFMWGVNVVDVKMNTILVVAGQFFTRYAVIYNNN